jgi:dihydrodipicolinate synthase/N-acetylneuraminate lyase
MSLPPDWADSCTVESLAEHYAEVAKVIPLMIITNILGLRGERFGLDAIRLSLDRSPNIVAIKDDTADAFSQKMCLMAHDKCVVMAGGLKQTHLNILPFGCQCFMSTYLVFYPEVTRRYCAAIDAGKMTTACEIVRDYDQAYFSHISSYPGGWNAGLHGTLELFGICQRWRRKPYHSLSDEDMEKLKDFFQRLSIL